MNIEEYYTKQGYPTLDKFDKKANKFDYWTLIDFAESYHQAKVKENELLHSVSVSISEDERWAIDYFNKTMCNNKFVDFVDWMKITESYSR